MTALRRTVRLEHRLTRPNASLAELDAAVALAIEHGMATLAVSPWLVRSAARGLARNPVRLATVIGYPSGAQVSTVKAFEASQALEHGATELNFVLNAGALRSGDDEAVLNDMLAVVEMAHSALATAGVIVRSGPLSDELILRACRLAARAGVDHVVTSPGEDEASTAIELAGLIHATVGEHLAVTAAGDFRDLSSIEAAATVGADRISTAFSPDLAAEAHAWQQPALAGAAADVGVAAG